MRWEVGRYKCIGHHSLWQKLSKNLPSFLAFLDPNSLKPESIGKLQEKKRQLSCFVRATRLLIYQLNRKGRSKQLPSLLWKLRILYNLFYWFYHCICCLIQPSKGQILYLVSPRLSPNGFGLVCKNSAFCAGRAGVFYMIALLESPDHWKSFPISTHSPFDHLT